MRHLHQCAGNDANVPVWPPCRVPPVLRQNDPKCRRATVAPFALCYLQVINTRNVCPQHSGLHNTVHYTLTTLPSSCPPRARINRLTSGSTSWRLQGSASTYSMGSKSWSVPGSASSYSVDARVTQSASLYSMSSGSSCVSGISNMSSCSGTSGTSGMSSTSSTSGTTDGSLHGHSHRHGAGGGGCTSSCSTSGCLGAVPRNPAYQHYHKKGQYYMKVTGLGGLS